MGNHAACQLGCGGPCEACCNSWCAKERCSQVCFGERCQRPVVQTLASALDERVPPPPAERYDLPGVGAAQDQLGPPNRGGFCFGGMRDEEESEERMIEEAMNQLPMDRFEQVHPPAASAPRPGAGRGGGGGAAGGGPSGTDLANIGERKPMEALKDECRFNPGKLQKISELAEVYGHWRPIRGDGNCFYRTVAYGAIEALLAAGDRPGIERLACVFEQVRFDAPCDLSQGPALRRAHEALLKRLRSWREPEQLELWISQDSFLDQALIRACRRLVRMFLVGHAKKETPSGLTYEELVMALDDSYTTVEEFCASVVDPMGRDAETLALDALPLQLGIGLRLWLLDRRDEVDLLKLDTPTTDGKVHVHALFKPGHYDLLYPLSGPHPIDVDAGATKEP